MSPFPIAYVAGQFPKRSETFVFNEVRALRARGWTVHTIGLHAPDEETPADLLDLRETTQIAYAGSGAKRLLSHPLAAIRGAIDAAGSREKTKEDLKLVAQAAAGAALGAKLRALGVRHVRAHFAHAPTSVAMYAARAAGVSFSFTGHANDLFQRRQALKLKLKRAAFVGCISEWHRDLYRSIVPGDDAKYPIIRCGVDVSALAPTPHARGRRVLTVCRLVEKKGVDTLIRAAGVLRERGSPIEVVVGGDGPMLADLKALAKPQGDGVQFLGALTSAQVRDELARADAFALPCRVDANGDKDGIPVVLMEAMACGLPVVSGDLPAIRELVADRRTGLLVPGGDVNATADAIDQALADDGTLAEAGRRKVVEEFSIDGTVAQLERSFERAVASHLG
jgi:colanic acid/amylovoran biosynthesis glycosyltransferase